MKYLEINGEWDVRIFEFNDLGDVPIYRFKFLKSTNRLLDLFSLYSIRYPIIAFSSNDTLEEI